MRGMFACRVHDHDNIYYINWTAVSDGLHTLNVKVTLCYYMFYSAVWDFYDTLYARIVYWYIQQSSFDVIVFTPWYHNVPTYLYNS